MRFVALAAIFALLPALPMEAQGAKTYKTRLSPVPIPAYQPTVVGTGTVTATLTGTKLTIAGKGTHELPPLRKSAVCRGVAAPYELKSCRVNERRGQGFHGSIVSVARLTVARSRSLAAEVVPRLG